MSKKKASKRSRSERLHEVFGIVSLAGAAIVAMALLSFDVADPTWFHRRAPGADVHNWAGRVGATLADGLLQLLGVAAILVPVGLAVLGWRRLRNRPVLAALGPSVSYALFFLSLLAFLDLLFGRSRIDWGGATYRAGGLFGHAVADALRAVLNDPGAVIFAATVLAAIIVLTTRASFVRASEFATAGIARVGSKVGGVFGAGARAWKERRATRAAEARLDRTKRRLDADAAERPPAPEPPRPAEPAPAEVVAADAPPRRDRPRDRDRLIVPPKSSPDTRAASKPAARQGALPLGPVDSGKYALPPLDLLRPPEPQAGEDESRLLERAEVLTEKFREFSVGGSVEAIHPGPVVTTFEFQPDAGVKYSKITGLVNDLALGLKAESVRVDRVPASSTVGIEVPNENQETIYPKELIGSEKFRRSTSKLTLALGKDIGGDVFVAELDKMPHLLIAGATGAGKSVGLNGMIASILFKSTPDDVRFIMIDTKMIELGLYADIPHLLIPVVTEPKNASNALKWAVREMEHRYRKLAAVGVRNITQFNELIRKEPDRTMEDERSDEPIPLAHLPYIVIVIDEMADLMMVAASDVEESIMRLAQMARAVGIHLILATQRPSVDVITGTIKANFPCRIAYRVSQRVDSRTIIDQQGAEHLLGRGDMLYLGNGSNRLRRLHGAYITEPELEHVIAFLKKTAKPAYDESVLKEPDESGPGGLDGGDRDEFFVPAVELVLNEGACSITMIQRRLRLGYARAARIVDGMEQAGIVGRADGAKPREVLVGPDILETLRSQG